MKKTYRHSWIDVDSVNTHYIEAGKGEPLILIHGGGAGSSGEANYGDIVGQLGEEYHTIAPDIIGFGYTDPRGPQDYSGKAQGDFLVRLLETLDLGPVILAGNSHGGFLVQYVAHERPKLVKRLIIINSLNGTFPIPPLPEGRIYIHASGGHQPRKPDKKSIKRNMKTFYAHIDLVTDRRIDLSYDTTLRNYKYAAERGRNVSSSVEVLNENLSYKGRHISEWASQLKMPVLLTWSEPGSKIEWGITHFFKIPGAEMHLFSWSGHHVQIDQSARWVQVVTNWLKNEPARPIEYQYQRRRRIWEDSFIDVNGVNAHYIEAGKGEVFVMIHGGGTLGTGWGPTVNYLCDYFHSIAPDTIGSGMTLARGPQDYSGSAQGDFLIDFIEALDLGPVHLAGQSHGGFLVQYIAHERPDLVKRLIISNSMNGTHPIPPLPEGRIYIHGPGGHQYKKPTIESIRKFLGRFYDPEDITYELIKQRYEYALITWEYGEKQGNAVSSSVEASNRNLSYKGKHISEWASELKMPVLLMWSEPGSKIEWGLSHFFKIPGAEMHILPYSGHGLHRDQVERWVQVVANWTLNEPVRPPS